MTITSKYELMIKENERLRVTVCFCEKVVDDKKYITSQC